MHEFDWSPGIGDPTIGGWLTVILYFLTMVSCWRTADIIRLTEYISSEKYTWRAVSILFLALGINKQLDLQTALTELGRVVSSHRQVYRSANLGPDLELGLGDGRHLPGARCERVAALESQYASHAVKLVSGKIIAHQCQMTATLPANIAPAKYIPSPSAHRR